ncbi:hypothetical protein PtA15_15A488 [Puccinia triticina]|uniref:Uncharacterized protein n=1 Tax=Puccinia triticina TaxID=208348 RepID=A0ABY7D5Y7_9BASI|nr:uncharacterized protein PtA15_15A488 [Puccinia triticina]WAQ92092.1 hypothetical protein PtA15_15A488 [Puccinia triticina]
MRHLGEVRPLGLLGDPETHRGGLRAAILTEPDGLAAATPASTPTSRPGRRNDTPPGRPYGA